MIPNFTFLSHFHCTVVVQSSDICLKVARPWVIIPHSQNWEKNRQMKTKALKKSDIGRNSVTCFILNLIYENDKLIWKH